MGVESEILGFYILPSCMVIIINIIITILQIWVFFLQVCLFSVCMQYQKRPERMIDPVELELKPLEAAIGVLGIEPLEEQPVLSDAKPSLQPLRWLSLTASGSVGLVFPPLRIAKLFHGNLWSENMVESAIIRHLRMALFQYACVPVATFD